MLFCGRTNPRAVCAALLVLDGNPDFALWDLLRSVAVKVGQMDVTRLGGSLTVPHRSDRQRGKGPSDTSCQRNIHPLELPRCHYAAR